MTALVGLSCGSSPAHETARTTSSPGATPPGDEDVASLPLTVEPSPYAGPDAPTDLLQWGAGAFVVRDDSPPATFTSKALIDGLHDTIRIAIPKREPLPHRLVVELPALTTFQTFAVPVIDEYGPARGRHVRFVGIEGSTEGPDAGFVPMVTLSIQLDQKQPQYFSVPSPRPARWVRITLRERLLAPPNDVDPTVFSELMGYGEQEPIAVPPEHFTGRWRYRRTGIHDNPGLNIIDLVQKGTSIEGCQIVGGKQSPVLGEVVDGIARLTFAPEGPTGGTPVVATVTSEGALVGARFTGGFLPLWTSPDPSAPAPCSPGPAKEDPIVATLRDKRPAVLYGIHFDVDSDELRPEATPALERIREALASATDLIVEIEGHTDSDGSDAHNLSLSDRRAKAVVDWLVEKGIAKTRLSSSGKGETEPIADNATLAGKQLNRRVEIEPR